MSNRFKIRFVGRFVFACQGTAASPTKITALAMDMTYNADLGAAEHHALLCGPRADALMLGLRAPDMTLFGITATPDPRAQSLVWDIAGYDLAVAGAGSGLTVKDWGTLRDIGAAHAGQPARTLDLALVAEAPLLDGPVLSRFVFDAGDFAAIQFDPARQVSYEPLAHEGPVATATQPMVDVVDVTVTTAGALYLELKGHDDAERSSIGFAADAAADVVLIVSNLCPSPGAPDDREFAAYYDVLADPPTVRDRLVPFGIPEMGTRIDCTGLATVYY